MSVCLSISVMIDLHNNVHSLINDLLGGEFVEF